MADLNFQLHQLPQRFACVNPKRHWMRGLTLVELLVAISIAAILGSLAAPALTSFVSRNAVRALSGDFTMSLQRARAEAINRNQCVVMCLSSDPTAANPRCATTGNNWNVGWVIYVEPTCTGDDALDSTAEATAAVAAGRLVYAKESVETRYNLIPSPASRVILFNARGVSGLSGAASFNIADSYASTADQNKYGRTLCFDKTGRVRSVAYLGSCS
ncbi:MAG: hypothetical protein RLZZ612_426 [Pseudomonadota bacterium]|jgi:type IV fimbrial biogenesis protein FimT